MAEATGNTSSSCATGRAGMRKPIFARLASVVSESRATLSILAWATAVSLLMSTEYLAQPFVWRGWPIEDVMRGWTYIAFDRLLVAFSIALCVVIAQRARVANHWLQLLLLAVSVCAGAVLGEGLRFEFSPFSRADESIFVGNAVRWALVGLAMAGIFACWRLNADYRIRAAEAISTAAQTRRMLVAAELDALQRQIEPHFLFNTLATIRHFSQTAPADGYALLDRLFEYISTTLAASQKHESDLGSELDLVQAYLAVCQVRMGQRLRIEQDVPGQLRACRFPPLMLGTLVENAVRHGLAPLAEGGTVVLSAERHGNMLHASVRDDGAGLKEEGGAGIGLTNICTRLHLLYGDMASFHLEAIAPHGVCATLRIPYGVVG